MYSLISQCALKLKYRENKQLEIKIDKNTNNKLIYIAPLKNKVYKVLYRELRQNK